MIVKRPCRHSLSAKNVCRHIIRDFFTILQMLNFLILSSFLQILPCNGEIASWKFCRHGLQVLLFMGNLGIIFGHFRYDALQVFLLYHVFVFSVIGEYQFKETSHASSQVGFYYYLVSCFYIFKWCNKTRKTLFSHDNKSRKQYTQHQQIYYRAF